MTRVDIFSGFLGAGKTTLIKKMIQEAYQGEKLVLIENEFGEIGIDGGFLQDAGVNIKEMNSGCICCSLVGDFCKALSQVVTEYQPDRILIEPSGVGKLSDVVASVVKVTGEDVVLGSKVAVADAGKVKVYMKNFGEFYNDQIETADTIILSRTDSIPQSKLDAAVELLRQHNATAALVTTPWDQLSGFQLLDAMEGNDSLSAELERLAQEQEHHCCCGHHHEEEHHHHHHDDEHCCCGHQHEEEHHHHHHDDEHCCCGHHHEEEHHHHHHEDEHCCCGHHHDEEHHHHHDGETCGCGHHHGEHHHHDAQEVFTSWGVETAKKFTVEDIKNALCELDSGKYGIVLRAKGIVASDSVQWIHFDYVPEEHNVRNGGAGVIGKLCVIGSHLDEGAIAALFGV